MEYRDALLSENRRFTQRLDQMNAQLCRLRLDLQTALGKLNALTRMAEASVLERKTEPQEEETE